jgi:hypothetical protein
MMAIASLQISNELLCEAPSIDYLRTWDFKCRDGFIPDMACACVPGSEFGSVILETCCSLLTTPHQFFICHLRRP